MDHPTEPMREENAPLLENEPEQIPAPPVDPVRGARRQFSLTLLSFLFILLVSEIVATVVYYAFKANFPNIIDLPGALLFFSSLPAYAVAMPLSLLFFKRIPRALPEKHSLSLPSFVGLFCLTMLLTYAGSIAGNIVNSILTFWSGEAPTNDLQNLADNSPIWCQILFFVILAPIFEEIFYRKLIFDRIRAYGELPAILLCGILFGLIHGNFYQFFYAAAIGILFCYVYARTGKIGYTIGLHMLLNFSGTILTEWFGRLLSSEVEWLFLAGVILLAVLGICFLAAFGYAIYCWIKERKKITFAVGECQLEPKQWLQALFGSPVTWIALFLLVLPFFSDFIRSLF